MEKDEGPRLRIRLFLSRGRNSHKSELCQSLFVQNFLDQEVGLLDTLIECGQLCPHSLEIVIERVNELQRAGVGRSMPLAWSIGVVSNVLAEDWVDGEELVAVPNVASAAWTAGAKQDMLDSVLLSGVEVENLGMLLLDAGSCL